MIRSCPAAIVAYQGGRPSGSPWPVLVRQGCDQEEAAEARLTAHALTAPLCMGAPGSPPWCCSALCCC